MTKIIPDFTIRECQQCRKELGDSCLKGYYKYGDIWLCHKHYDKTINQMEKH